MSDQLVDLLSQLVAIDSVNPALVQGGAGESEIVATLELWGADAGLDLERLEATPGRPSLLLTASGSGGGSTLMLCGHVDTVGVEGMASPLEPRRDGDRLHGRGSYDMKGGLAAALIACREAAGMGLAGDVVVAAVADEEHSSIGVQEAVAARRAHAAIVTEPTELELVVAHKGFVWSEIEIAGRAAHGSRPHLGVDAIAKAGPVLTAIGELDEALGAREHALLGRGSVHASLIQGGVEMSSYPPSCTIGLERRTLPGESAGHVEAELEQRLEECRRRDPALEATPRTLLVREPFESGAEDELVKTVEEAAAEVLGEQPSRTGASFWADSAFIAAAGVPTLLFGPAGEGAHAEEEWVSVSSCEQVARVLTAVAARVCA